MKEDDILIRKRSLALRYRAMAGEKLVRFCLKPTH